MPDREIARRLSDDGITWETVVVEEDSGGGFTPVGAVLARDSATAIRLVGDHPILWEGVYDNYEDFNQLTEIPAGLGLAFAFDGTDAAITTTVAGVWSFCYVDMIVPPDTSFRGIFDTGTGNVQIFTDPQGMQFMVTSLLSLPAGGSFTPKVVTSTQANDVALALQTCYLIATRLG